MNAKKALTTTVKVVVIGAAAYYLVRAVLDGAAVLGESLDANDVPAAVVMVATAISAMVWIAAIWVVILRRYGGSLGLGRGLAIYFVGEATKYLPGAFWPVLGRSELAVREGVARSSAYASTLLSLVLNFLLAGLVASALAAPFALSSDLGVTTPLWLLLILPMGITALHPKIVGSALTVAERLTRRAIPIEVLPWGTSVGLVFAYLPAWAAIGFANRIAAEIVGVSPDLGLLVFASYLAWVAGFLAIPAPSGLGVREAVFAALMTNVMGSPTASAIALLSRVAFVFADAGGALVGLVLIRRSVPQPPVEESEP